jgi:hypothetical protein
MKKILLIISTMFYSFISSSHSVFAQDSGSLQRFGDQAGYSTDTAKDPGAIASDFISTSLSYIGIIAVILFVIAGFIWMTAGGNPKKVETAKQMIFNTVIGLVIIFAAFAIVMTVIRTVGTK